MNQFSFKYISPVEKFVKESINPDSISQRNNYSQTDNQVTLSKNSAKISSRDINEFTTPPKSFYSTRTDIIDSPSMLYDE